MANTKSAEKANRQSIKRRARNVQVASGVRTSVRKFRETLEGGDAAKTGAELKAAIKTISKAATKGVIHKAQASRRIARLTKAAQAKSAAK